MELSEEARERLADVVRLQPTTNAELGDRWGMADGSEVHQYLEARLSDYYYRDEESYVRATDEAATLVDVDPGGVTDEESDRTDAAAGRGDGERDTPSVVRVPELRARAFEVLPHPDERAASVVAVLHDLRATFDIDPPAEAVRRALHALRRAGVATVERRTVPTFKRASDLGDVRVEVSEPSDWSSSDGEDVLGRIEPGGEED